MVGMQASLHTAREDSLRDLMKSDDDPMGTFDEVNELNDDFNPDALLMEPLFNDSAGKLDQSFSHESEFGQFEEPHDTLLGRPDRTPVPPPAMEYSESAKRPARPAIVRESRNVKLPSASSMMMNGNGMSNIMAHHPQQQQQQSQQAPPQQPLQSSFAGYNAGMQQGGGGIPSVIGVMATQVTDDSMSHFDQSQSDMQDYSMQSYRSPSRRMPDRSISSNSSYESDSPVMGRSAASNMYGGQPSMLTPARALPPKAQSYGGALMGTQSNDLSMMRQQLQRMRDLDIRENSMQQGRRTSDSSNLTSQSMHLPVQRTTSASAALSRSMHFEPGQGSFSNMSGGPPFGGGNVSIASDARSFKPSFNHMDGSSMAGASNVNEAMEKLCESMKRSAMSRSLVKQYSSGRGVSRHGSGQLYAMRQAAGHSSRNSMDDSSGRRAPVRRLSSTKHHLQHPVRGVNRHDSAKSAHSMNLQINMDGRYMGGL